MPAFRYTAINPAGALVHGEIEAKDDADVIRQLRRQGSIPVRASARAGFSAAALLQRDIGRGSALRRGELTNATRELSLMLGAGQDLDRALRFLVEVAPTRRVAAVIEAVRGRIRDGSSLAAALRHQPRSFPPLFVGMVNAGEAGGTLAPTLDRLANLMERERSLVSTVRSAMIYPALLVVAASGSIILLLTQVLPQFVPLFEQNGATLPRSTELLIQMGHAVSAYGLYALALAALAFAAVWALLRRPAARLALDRATLRLPVAGGLLREVLAARFTRTLGTLLVNGVPLIGALAIVRGVVGNRAGVAAIDAATLSAKAGAGLSRPLAATGVMPARTIYLLRLGEETAKLGPMALQAAEIHEEAVRIGTQRLVALAVPAITLVMGAAIAWIVVALLAAMLGLNDLAQ